MDYSKRLAKSSADLPWALLVINAPTEHFRLPTFLLVGVCALFPTRFALGQARTQASAPAVEDAVPEGLSKGDWAGIRAAYDTERHAAYPVEDGYEARNPGQAWRTHFDGRGFLTEPDAGGRGAASGPRRFPGHSTRPGSQRRRPSRTGTIGATAPP